MGGGHQSPRTASRNLEFAQPAAGSSRQLDFGGVIPIPLSRKGDVEEEEEEHDIPEDAYGAAILAIVKDLQDVLRGRDVFTNAVTASFAILVLFCNLGLQFGLVSFISELVVEPKVFSVQEVYKLFSEQAIDENGIVDADKWEDFDSKPLLCQIAVVNMKFFYLTLFLWVLSMTKEFRTTCELFSLIWQVPRCSLGADMLRQLRDDKVSVVALTQPVRITLLAVVVLPKFLICFALLWLGCQWLAATDAFEDLVMNAVAMEFVTHIDELLYEVLLPASYRSQVSGINFAVPVKKADHEREKFVSMYAYRTSVIYIIFACFWVIFYGEVLQNVLPFPKDLRDLRRNCLEFQGKMRPFCNQGVLANIKALIFHSSPTDPCYPREGDEVSGEELVVSSGKHHGQAGAVGRLLTSLTGYPVHSFFEVFT
eukprot:TRINITY_DN42149_c0_g1_i1.p1 TRINITY_DN42149_c0_g1~~TRINITY_DN42149_c0_g1_i1.p1  ORF type:complete len:425 (+),score=87.85 TRINITY_DN42149_c0_g1_i1:144-1418(+)